MSEAERFALLAAIRHAPDDDAPRLIYADWCDEHGEPERAEFVRVGIEMRREWERHGRPTDRLDRLFLRKKELFHWSWADTVRRWEWVIARYTRGFPSRLEGRWDEFVRDGAEVARWAAAGAGVRLTGAADAIPHLADCPALGRLPCVSLSFERITDQHLHQLVTRNELGGIETLDLSGNRITDAGLWQLVRTQTLTALTELRLTDNPIGPSPDAMRELLSSRRLPRLQRVTVDGDRYSVESRRSLQAAAQLGGVEVEFSPAPPVAVK